MIIIETQLNELHFQEGDKHPFEYDRSLLRQDIIVHISGEHISQVRSMFNCNIDRTFSCFGDVAKTVLLNIKL